MHVNGARERIVAGISWEHAGPAAFDFRSDVHTTPTAAMLDAIVHATLLDDVSRADHNTNSLEEYMAALTGHEAALFVLSGTMGNILGFRSLLNHPPYSILCDSRGHSYTSEGGGASNGLYITLEDIQENAAVYDSKNISSAPTRVIALENTLDGLIMPLSETRRISKYAREHGIKIHLDGARLWDVVIAGAGSLIDFCSLFDTVTMCFSKGLGAPTGSILVGNKATIEYARWMRKALGGGMRMTGVLTGPARVAIEETFKSGLMDRGHRFAREIERLWEDCGGRLTYPVQTNMVWLDCSRQSFTPEEFKTKASRRGIKVDSFRLVFHHQISEEAMASLKALIVSLTSKTSMPVSAADSEGTQKQQPIMANGGSSSK